MCVRRSTRSTTPSLVTGLGDGGADAKARDRALRQQAKEKRAFEADRKAFRAEMAAMRQDQQAQHDAFLQMMATMNQRNTGASSSPSTGVGGIGSLLAPTSTPCASTTATMPVALPPPLSTVATAPGPAVAFAQSSPGSSWSSFSGFAPSTTGGAPVYTGPSTSTGFGGPLPFLGTSGAPSVPTTLLPAWVPQSVAPSLAPPSSSGFILPSPVAGGSCMPPSGGNPAVTGGLISGSRVTAALKEKIWNGDYVPFWDLLHPDLDGPADAQKDPSRSKRSPLSGLEWHRAFLSFVGIRGERFPQEIDALLRYGGFIGELMEQQVDWAFYDKRFRWDKASDPQFHDFPWNQIRQQVVNEAYRSHERRPGGGTSAQATFRATQSGIPSGYCFKHHEAGTEDCHSKACNFIHKCPKCLGNHALHRHYAARSGGRRSSPRKRDHAPKSANAYKERRR